MRTSLRSSLLLLAFASVAGASSIACGGAAPAEPTGASDEALSICYWPQVRQCSDPGEIPGGKVACWCDYQDAPTITQVTTGTATTYAIDDEGLVYTWGSGAHYARGDNSTSDVSFIQSPLTKNRTSKLPTYWYHAADVVAGDGGACLAQKSDGTVVCWGTIATGTDWATPAPVGMPPVLTTQPHQIAHGAHHTCAISSTDASVYCWGDNASGQLGDGTTTPHVAPAQVTSPDVYSITQIAAAGDTTCALREAQCDLGICKTVWCWGDNSYGQVGYGSDARGSYFPNAVQTISWAIDPDWISGGGTATFCGGSNTSSTVQCWGANLNGQVGVGQPGTPATEDSPVKATNAFGSSMQAFGSGESGAPLGSGHTCALAGNHVKCWGDGASGQLGNAANGSSIAPVDVVSPDPNRVQFAGIAASGAFTCGVLSHADYSTGVNVACWGANDHGQLGNKSLTAANTPSLMYWF